MQRIRSRFVFTSVLVSSFTLFGCSSDGDSGTPRLTITEANAKQAVVDAIEGGAVLLDVGDTLPTAVAIDQAPSPRDITNLAIDKAMSMQDSGLAGLPTGVVIEPIPCTGGGTITGDVTDTSAGPVLSVTGTATFNQCTEAGITLNGTVTFSQSIDSSDSTYAITMAGNLSGSDGVDSVTLNNLSFDQTGDLDTGASTINTFTFSVDFSDGGGFSAELLAAIVSNEGLSCPVSPSSGVVLVTGASNTQAKGTVNGDGTVTVEFNPGSGTFIPVTTPGDGSPYPCSDFFL